MVNPARGVSVIFGHNRQIKSDLPGVFFGAVSAGNESVLFVLIQNNAIFGLEILQIERLP